MKTTPEQRKELWTAANVGRRTASRSETLNLLDDIETLIAENARLRFALEKTTVFIDYARYELQPGKSSIGDQFPKQEDADAVLKLARAALSGETQ